MHALEHLPTEVARRDGREPLPLMFPVDTGLQMIKPLMEKVHIAETLEVEDNLETLRAAIAGLGKDKGPSGSATLCARCSQRYRRGQSPPQQQSQASASKRQRTEGKPRSAARETTARKNGRASQQTPPHPHQHHLLLRQAGLAGGTSGQVVATSSTTVGEEIADV